MNGFPIKMVLFITEDDDSALGVAFTDFPPSITADGGAALDRFAEGAADQRGSKLVSKSPTTFLGHEARDFVISARDGEARVTARNFLVGDRVYLLQAVERWKEGRSERFDRFASSVKVL